MTYNDLITKVRNILDDNVEPYLWTDDELFSYAVKAVNAVRMHTGLSSEWFNYTTVADTDNIQLNTNVFEVFNVNLESIPLYRVEPHEIFMAYPQATGKPRCYSFHEKRLYLYPKPDIVYQVRVLASTISNPVSDMEEIALPAEYQDFTIEGILADAYSKNDLETLNLQKAERYRLLFRDRIEQIKNLKRRGEISMQLPSYLKGLF